MDGAPGVPGYDQNTLNSGGGVSWTGGLNFTVSAATYTINNASYSLPQTDVTIATADPTNPRFDVIAANTSGAVVVLEGTPASSPARPDVDPLTQLMLTFVRIDAGASAPADVVLSDVYHENTEWSTSRSGTTITLASTSNPHAGTVDVEGTNTTANNYVQFQAPSPLDPASRNTLVFFIRSKASWPATRGLYLTLRSGGTLKGSGVTLTSGQFGFSSSTTGVYQQIVVPMPLFAANGLSVNQLRIAVIGTGATIGWYLDDVTLQGGVNPPGAPFSMSWKGPWNSSLSYAVNDVVTYVGTQWVALAPNTNSAPSDGNASWVNSVAPSGLVRGAAALTTDHKVVSVSTTDGSLEEIPNQNANVVYAGPGTGSAAAPSFRALVSADVPSALRSRSFGAAFDGGGAELADGISSHAVVVPYSCTISAWNLTVNGGTATVKVWKKASGTAVPTVSDSINTSGVSISTGTAVHSTTVTDFTSTAVSANDMVIVNLTAVDTATKVMASFQCDI
jgi:hypothetical protein